MPERKRFFLIEAFPKLLNCDLLGHIPSPLPQGLLWPGDGPTWHNQPPLHLQQGWTIPFFSKSRIWKFREKEHWKLFSQMAIIYKGGGGVSGEVDCRSPLYMIINSVSLQLLKNEVQSVPDFLEEQFYIPVSDVTSQFHFLSQVPGLSHLQIGSPPQHPLVYFTMRIQIRW